MSNEQKKQKIANLIKQQLKDLDVDPTSEAWAKTASAAFEASDILNKKQLIKYIEEYLETLPNYCF